MSFITTFFCWLRLMGTLVWYLEDWCAMGRWKEEAGLRVPLAGFHGCRLVFLFLFDSELTGCFRDGVEGYDGFYAEVSHDIYVLLYAAFASIYDSVLGDGLGKRPGIVLRVIIMRYGAVADLTYNPFERKMKTDIQGCKRLVGYVECDVCGGVTEAGLEALHVNVLLAGVQSASCHVLVFTTHS